MRHHVKSAYDTLVALDFQLDHDDRKLRTDRWIFTHANSPDERLTLNYRMSEPAARTVVQKAKAIVGLATTETGKATRRARDAARSKVERAADRSRVEATRRMQQAREDERRAQRLVTAAEQRYGELDRLLRGGPSSAPGGTVIDTAAMLTVAQVADETGLSDKVVQRAIDAGTLEAYMCSGVVRVKGTDLVAWLKASAA